ncbi:DUF362 domain-containing protein [Methanocella arvoryzae]|uniref:4Fe-4S ferredoxin-domain protein n=1 Tax=Methanocella arvoryzae (strain DSM 22066 / NBRC 105507 / MRE50) TaxID=351160 RepID=Q0W4U5_METAR|nr:DUF362 domain-containing protein [Methanocella arvoryzae]CAJ36598.1 4Fe-4S ferredoxin-domain protein [Methanocella arvoryzae MRE50]
MTIVSIVKNADPARALKDAVELIGGLDVKGTVLVKPNLSCARPSGSGLVTNVEVVKAVVEMVAARGARPIVGDLPILGWDADAVFDTTGIREIEKAGGEFIDWRNNHVEIQLQEAGVLKKVRIARPAIEADYIINVPVLKHHFFTHISGAMKNLFGVVEPDFRPLVHVLGLDEPLVDLYEFLRPKVALNVLDATCIAQSVRPSGPYYGPTAARSVTKLNMIAVSRDAVALDATAARMIRVDPEAVEMVRLAAGRGLGTMNPQTIGNARGATLRIKRSPLGRILPYAQDAWSSERLNRISHPLVRRMYGDDVVTLEDARHEMDRADPANIVVAGACKRCGLCTSACPVKNITLSGSRPILGNKCIKCFICVEICPDGALAIERKSQ